jgi:hypothetical protein
LDEKREALAHDIARAERALQRDDAAFEAGMLDSRLEILPTCRVATPEVRALPSSVEHPGIEPVTSGLQSRLRRLPLFAVVLGSRFAPRLRSSTTARVAVVCRRYFPTALQLACTALVAIARCEHVRTCGLPLPSKRSWRRRGGNWKKQPRYARVSAAAYQEPWL